MKNIYRSKVDLWLLAIILVAMVTCLFSVIPVFLAGVSYQWLLLVPLLGIGVGLPLWILLGTHYTLEPTQLLVRSGPFRWRIPIADITKVAPSSSALSSPALSLDRLRIEYGRYMEILISPHDKEQFLRDLNSLRR